MITKITKKDWIHSIREGLIPGSKSYTTIIDKQRKEQ